MVDHRDPDDDRRDDVPATTGVPTEPVAKEGAAGRRCFADPRPLGSFRSMSVANSKKAAPVHSGFEWAGMVARARRSGVSYRSGRRSALLGVLTSVYANSSRGGRPGETRNSGSTSSDRG